MVKLLLNALETLSALSQVLIYPGHGHAENWKQKREKGRESEFTTRRTNFTLMTGFPPKKQDQSSAKKALNATQLSTQTFKCTLTMNI